MDLLKRHSENKPGKHVKTSNCNNNTQNNTAKNSHIDNKLDNSHNDSQR